MILENLRFKLLLTGKYVDTYKWVTAGSATSTTTSAL